MSLPNERTELIGALREYLEELQDTGVEWLDLPQAQGAPILPAYSPASMASREAAPSTVPDSAKVESLDDIRKELGECRRCALCQERKNIVFGVGSPNARIVFVGEAPGRDEDLQGEPFVGEAGQLLNRIITRMGLKREDVYICNVLKCRPPGNRNPEPAEIELCAPFMLRQVKSIAPDVVVALGTFAAQTLLGTKAPISKLRSHFYDYHGIPLMPTFHPSFLLHNKNDKTKFWEVWDDMVQVLRKLDLPVPDVQRKGP
jgi:DNA polymerase